MGSRGWVPLKEASTHTGFSVKTLEGFIRRGWLRTGLDGKTITVRVVDVYRVAEKEGAQKEFAPKRKENSMTPAAKSKRKTWTPRRETVLEALKKYPNEIVTLHQLEEETGLPRMVLLNTIRNMVLHKNIGRYVSRPSQDTVLYRTVSEEKLAALLEASITDSTEPSNNGTDSGSPEQTPTAPVGPNWYLLEEVTVTPDGRVLVKDDDGNVYWLVKA